MAPQGLTRAEQDDIGLMHEVAARDRQAFETLYNRHYRNLYAYLFRFLQQRELAEEVVNDVMLVVWVNAARYDPNQSRFATWLFGIANNKMLKARAKKGDKLAKSSPAIEFSTDPEGPEVLMSREQTGSMVMRALQDLSTEQRNVMELSYYHGFSYQEIAQIVDCPPNTVKTRMFHARKRLERLLPRMGIRGDAA